MGGNRASKSHPSGGLREETNPPDITAAVDETKRKTGTKLEALSTTI
jgi:hypothetical protein